MKSPGRSWSGRQRRKAQSGGVTFLTLFGHLKHSDGKNQNKQLTLNLESLETDSV